MAISDEHLRELAMGGPDAWRLSDYGDGELIAEELLAYREAMARLREMGAVLDGGADSGGWEVLEMVLGTFQGDTPVEAIAAAYSAWKEARR